MIEFFKQDVDTGKRDLVNVAREIMRELCHTRPSVQSSLQFLDVYSSYNVGKYCIFLKKMVVSKKLGDEKDLYINLLSSIVKLFG